jgi:L-fuculose-phosphate aldolase
MDWQTACAELSDFGRLCVERELVVGRAGNISVRLDDGAFVISRRASRLDRLSPSDLVGCSPNNDEWQGDVHPSTETPVHRAIYQVQPAAQAILHSSAFYTTLVACSDIELCTDLFPESMAYLSRIGRVTYFHPGTKELAEAVRAMSANNVIILDNHGLIVWGHTLEEAVQVSEMMERVCRMLVVARLGTGAFSLNHLSQATVRDFEARILYRAQ